MTMDNKATGKSNLVVAFAEFLVCHLKLLECVRLIFLLKGHSVNEQDVSNEPTAIRFYSGHSKEWLVSPDEAAAVISHTAKHQTATVLSEVYDWGAALECDSIPMIGEGHTCSWLEYVSTVPALD